MYISTQSCKAQNALIMYQFVANLLAKEGFMCIMLQSEKHYHDGIPHGLSLLKIITQESYVDSNATLRQICSNLSSLDTYMANIKNDVVKFNQYIHTQLGSLSTRGKTMHNLLPNLFKGYKSIPNQTLALYILHKEEQYDDGIDISPYHLMLLAHNNYILLKEEHRWNATFEANKKLLELKAKIRKL